MKDLLLILIPAFAGFCAAWFMRRHDYEAGFIAGQNEELSKRNAIVIRAKYAARNEGIAFGIEHRDALMSRRAGNVSARTILTTASPQEVGVMPTRRRKPGIIDSAAPATQGAPISNDSGGVESRHAGPREIQLPRGTPGAIQRTS